MKYTRGQFKNEYYQLWQMGLHLPSHTNNSVFSVKFKKIDSEDFSRMTLKASSVSDALERACFAISILNSRRPEEIDLHSVYDEEENLLWIDEPYYEIVQKKFDFRGMERREFLLRFGATSAAILFGLKPVHANAETISISLGGIASGYMFPPGEQLYTTAGTYTWTVPAGITSVSVICVGGGGANAQAGGGVGTDNIGGGAAGGAGNSGGGGGALGYKNNLTVTAGSNLTVKVGGSSSRHTYFSNLIGSNFNYIGYGGTGGLGSGIGFSGGGGGGVGLLGQGSSGAGGIAAVGECGSGGNGTDGTAGAGGAGGGGAGGGGNGGGPGVGKIGSHTVTNLGCNQPYYGGGAGGDPSSSYGAPQTAGVGAVRIIWGSGRSFPSNAT